MFSIIGEESALLTTFPAWTIIKGFNTLTNRGADIQYS